MLDVIVLQPFAAGLPHTLCDVPNPSAFDVTANGQRFVIRTSDDNPDEVKFVLITGWFAELKAKMGAGR